jgi:hypothetical protein
MWSVYNVFIYPTSLSASHLNDGELGRKQFDFLCIRFLLIYIGFIHLLLTSINTIMHHE